MTSADCIVQPFAPLSCAPPAAANEPAPTKTHAWKDGGSFGFHDLLDLINPLKHIPIVSSIYRWLTGDTPGNVARIVGDGLFGGPIGLATGMLSVAFKEETGKDPGEMAITMLGEPSTPTVTLASPTAQPPAAAANLLPPAQSATPAAADAAGSPAVTAAPQPFLPLVKSPSPPPPSAPAGSAAEQAFLSQQAAYHRNIYGQRAPAPPRAITAPIPLQLTGPALPMARPMQRPVIPSAAAAPPVPPPGLPPTAPADLSQRMLDALDKYTRMQQQKRGQTIDVSP